MKKIYLLFLILTINLIQAQVPQSERDALIALYNGMNGANWVVNSNWTTAAPVSDWYGIFVQNINGQDHVTGINLENNSLSGNIPVEIGNLSQLQQLILYNNQLTGNFPSEIGNLNHLEILDLGYNYLTGNIPGTISNLGELEEFYIDSNQLGGDVPLGLFDSMPNLTTVYLDSNDLTGNIDFSHNPLLETLYAKTLQISNLDMRNGNNANIVDFDTAPNPNLTCIYVDDKNATYLSGWHISSNSHFVENQSECNALSINESLKENVIIYPNPFINKLNIATTDNIKTISIQNIQGQIVYKVNFKPFLNLSNLSAGIYLINIEDENGNIAVFNIIKK